MRIESRHGWVEVVEQTLTPRFIVTGSSGYRAELPICLFDPCTNGTKVSCVKPLTVNHHSQHSVSGGTSVDAWLKHSATHCHGWHWPKAEVFAREVLSTYGAKPKFESGRPGVPRGTDLPFAGAGCVHRDALLAANADSTVEQRKAQIEAWSTLADVPL